jgi:hypothetical protein
MRKLRAFCFRLLGFFRGRRADDDFAAELESHVALHTDAGIRAGLTAQEARRQALIHLGGVEQTQQAHRERRSLPWLDSLLRRRMHAGGWYRCMHCHLQPGKCGSIAIAALWRP